MSGVGNCYDNAAAESFFGLLKRERIHRRRYGTRAEARADVFDYIERFYNRQRSHSFTQGVPPRHFREHHAQKSSLACPWNQQVKTSRKRPAYSARFLKDRAVSAQFWVSPQYYIFFEGKWRKGI